MYKITGYASRFDEVDSQGDTMLKGCFAASIKQLADKGKTLPLLWEHNAENPIGHVGSIREDGTGLLITAFLHTENIEAAREVVSLLKVKCLDGLSICINTGKFTGAGNRKGSMTRVIATCDLIEISIVLNPSLETAKILESSEC